MLFPKWNCLEPVHSQHLLNWSKAFHGLFWTSVLCLSLFHQRLIAWSPCSPEDLQHFFAQSHPPNNLPMSDMLPWYANFFVAVPNQLDRMKLIRNLAHYSCLLYVYLCMVCMHCICLYVCLHLCVYVWLDACMFMFMCISIFMCLSVYVANTEA
jgi:hypothetical protein